MAFPTPGGQTQVLVPTSVLGGFDDMIADVNAQLAANPTYVPTGITYSASVGDNGIEFHSCHVEYYVGGAAAHARILTGLRSESVTDLASFINSTLAAHTNVSTQVLIQTAVLERGYHVMFAIVYQEY